MSKLVWKYNSETKQLTGNGVEVGDDYALKANETFTAPGNALLEPIIFNGVEWIGASFDDWLESNPSTSDPSKTDKAIANLMLQIAKQKANQDNFNAQLLLQIAQMKEEK